jgi:hypothetical protein
MTVAVKLIYQLVLKVFAWLVFLARNDAANHASYSCCGMRSRFCVFRSGSAKPSWTRRCWPRWLGFCHESCALTGS